MKTGNGSKQNNTFTTKPIDKLTINEIFLNTHLLTKKHVYTAMTDNIPLALSYNPDCLYESMANKELELFVA